MPIGNSDFARDFQIGASVARMAQQRQERMIELRAQAAQQAMRERETAAQVEMLLAHRDLYRQQVDEKLKAEADLQWYNQKSQYDMEVGGKSSEQASIENLIPLSRVNPKLAESVGGALKSQLEAQQVGKPRPLAPEQIAATEALTKQRLSAADENEAQIAAIKSGKVSGAQGPAAVSTASVKTQLEDEVTAAKATNDPVKIERAERALKNLNEQIKMQFRDPNQAAMRKIISMGITAIDRQLHSPMAAILLKDEEKAQLLEERKQWENQLKELGTEDDGQSVTSGAGPASTNEVKSIGGFKVRVKKP